MDLAEQMIRAIARQAEAERERRAKIIHAEGEYTAAEKLAMAAEVIQKQPAAIQLRYLQTLVEIGAGKNTTIVFPLPLDIIASLERALDRVRRPNPQADKSIKHAKQGHWRIRTGVGNRQLLSGFFIVVSCSRYSLPWDTSWGGNSDRPAWRRRRPPCPRPIRARHRCPPANPGSATPRRESAVTDAAPSG